MQDIHFLRNCNMNQNITEAYCQNTRGDKEGYGDHQKDLRVETKAEGRKTNNREEEKHDRQQQEKGKGPTTQYREGTSKNQTGADGKTEVW